MARKKGDKDYSKSEKQLLISLINDYSLFEATDSEVIQMLSHKIGKKISETLFYRLKKKSMKKRGESEQWLDYYAKYQYIEFFRKRLDDLEFVQKTLLQALVEEKEQVKKNKALINQLSKTIAENTKVLGAIGLAPPILAKMQSAITVNYNNSQSNKAKDEDIERIKYLANEDYDSGFRLELDNEDPSLEYEDDDAQRVF